jgi:hypothetical protein
MATLRRPFELKLTPILPTSSSQYSELPVWTSANGVEFSVQVRLAWTSLQTRDPYSSGCPG